jgi:hypothetical protein
MTKAYSTKGAAVFLLAALAVAGTIAAYLVANARADGRTLDGSFCQPPVPALCIQVASGQGTVAGAMGADQPSHVLTLQPGTYWLTVDDTSTRHDFMLRSCPGEVVLCDQTQSTGAAPAGNELQLTTIPGEGSVTVKINLKHGTYRLYCNAPLGVDSPTNHEAMGMYVDLEVGGVGQVPYTS